jgi:hypothetical protein
MTARYNAKSLFDLNGLLDREHRYPGYTFDNLVRQPDLEARQDDTDWWDNAGNQVPAPPGGTFVGHFSYSEDLTVSVIRNGMSRGGYLGLYEIAFFNPLKGKLQYGMEFYEPYELKLDEVTLTWLDEKEVTAIMQRVAHFMEGPVISRQALLMGLAVSAILTVLVALLLKIVIN